MFDKAERYKTAISARAPCRCGSGTCASVTNMWDKISWKLDDCH